MWESKRWRATSRDLARDAKASPGRSTPTSRLPGPGPLPGALRQLLTEPDVAAAIREPEQASKRDHVAPVQAKGALSGDKVHELAAHGIGGSGGGLPFLVQIQRAFGRHDVSDVRAHVGGAASEAATALGAEAYATGRDIAFRGAPDLRTAAHEAAHVVQQRGGVQLAGGVGAAGDIYERHADEVADAVVAGRSAESLLDVHAGGQPHPVQALQLLRHASTDAAQSAAIVQSIAAGDNVGAIRALSRAIEQARGRGGGPSPTTHVICVGGGDQFDLVLATDDLAELDHALGVRLDQLTRGAYDSAVARDRETMTDGTDARPMSGGTDTFARAFNQEFHDLLPALRQSDRPRGADEQRSPELTSAELHVLFSPGQRAKLTSFCQTRVIPDHLFDGDDVGGCNAQQRILVSEHILTRGEYREGSFAQRLHARMCGHWVELVHNYAGVAAAGGAGLENQLDHTGDTTLGSGRARVRFSGSREAIEGAGEDDQRQFRQQGLPVSEFDTIEPGDWLYVFTGVNTAGGNHSVIFVRWLGATHPIEGVQARRALLAGQSRPEDGGSEQPWLLGERFHRGEHGTIHPITRVQRHSADDRPPETVDDLMRHELGVNPSREGRREELMPELGTGPAAETNFQFILRLERRSQGRLDLVRLKDWIRRTNAELIARLGDHLTPGQRTLFEAANQDTDLEHLIRLNERLNWRVGNTAALDQAEGRQADRVEGRHADMEAELREREDAIQHELAELAPHIAEATELVDARTRTQALQRERANLLMRRIPYEHRLIPRIRRDDIRALHERRLRGYQDRVGEIDRLLAEPASERASAAAARTRGDGVGAARMRLNALVRQRTRLLDDLEALDAEAGYYTAQPGTPDLLHGRHEREDGRGMERERMTGRLSALHPEPPWDELVTAGEPGAASEAQASRRAAAREARRHRRHGHAR